MQRLVSPDVAHDGEEIGQGRHGLVVVEAQLAGPIGKLGPVIPVGKEDFLGPGGVFGIFFPLEERGVDRGHLQEPAGRTVPEDVFGVEGFAPGGQGLVVVLPGPVGRGPGIGQVFGQPDGGRGRLRNRRHGGSGGRARESERYGEKDGKDHGRYFFYHEKGPPGRQGGD